MPNPGGNYPGRQIFVGGLKSGHPAFCYFGSGRSAASKQRYASFIPEENSIRIKPTSPQEKFDPFRHYQAVRIDKETGLVVVSNSQAPQDPVFEAYMLMPEKEKTAPIFLRNLMSSIGPEYDSIENPTPRIVAVVFPFEKEFAWHAAVAPRRAPYSAVTSHSPVILDGNLAFLQTYNGEVNYGPFNTTLFSLGRSKFYTSAATAQELAEELYEKSGYEDPMHGELRVWAVAGVRTNAPGTEEAGGWEMAVRNRHQVSLIL
jgi:IMP cyclohydrolase